MSRQERMVAWTRAVVLNMERGGKKCILEVDPMEYANMGLREKEESITSPRFFFFTGATWMDHDAISEVREAEGGRGLKGALRVQFCTCWI